ncbi:response regulator [Labrenzia suaedae]|uniref:Response regulator n=2 Tax=Roseibium litorale TaxID=2803841 RepID=A0ABR9CN32_9HYPH|nr:response regulator [Roseibium litorale]
MIRALVADDSAVAREVVKDGIKLLGSKRYFDVTIAENGQQALNILQSKPVDIAFVDVNMPGASGPEVVAAMQQTQSKGCTSVVMSSSLNARVESVLKEFGAYHFLQKPFRAENVAEIISSYITMNECYPVLIVDDSATMRKLTRKILETSRFDFEISEADSAETALLAIKTGKFRMVITDFNMPGADGLELAGSIRELSSKIAIYMMSTNDTTYLERSAAFIGIDGFLKKPFNAGDIDALMHKLLGLDDPRFGKVRDVFSFLERERLKTGS